MSFFDDLKKMATDFLASPQGQGAVAAASEHITQMDPQQLAGHLQDSLGSMDAEKVTALGQQLLQTFTSHQAYQVTARKRTGGRHDGRSRDQRRARRGLVPDRLRAGAPRESCKRPQRLSCSAI